MDATLSEIETTLPQLSKIGSQDDMSIAMIFDTEKVLTTVPKLIDWQILNVKRLIADESAKIEKANNIQQTLEGVSIMTRQNIIDLHYANADEKRAIKTRTKLQGRLDSLLKELMGDDSKEDCKSELTEPYENKQSDEISFNDA